MKLHRHFLPQDLNQASREYHCTRDLLIKVSHELQHGNIEKAKHLSIDLTRSLHELERLADNKHEQDKVNHLIEMMGTSSIHAIHRFRGVGNE